MRPGHSAECELELGAVAQALCQAVGAADDEADGGAVLLAPLAQCCRQCRAVEIVASLVEDDDDRRFGNDIGDRYRFLDAPAFGIVRAALANFDDLDFAQAERAADRFGALAIGSGEVSLRPLLQPADGGDQNTHGRACLFFNGKGFSVPPSWSAAGRRRFCTLAILVWPCRRH